MPRTDPHPYDRLTPDTIIECVESVGRVSDRRILALNSYENRVYQVGIEGAAPIIVKFYRPDRWTDDAIHEEHGFALELAAAEIPVVPPQVREGQTLFEYESFRFAVFERRGGRWPELGTRTEREWMGRFLGRMHMIGRRQRFRFRDHLSVERLGLDSRNYLLDQGWIPPHLESAYDSLTADLIEAIENAFDDASGTTYIRLHGDCHRGNVLWTDEGPHFVDLDDCIMGPAIQDLWMLLAGNRAEMSEQLVQLLEGYSHFASFDRRELVLVESLRTLRMIHYAAWLAHRWTDPAFPQAFPWFMEPRYWETHVLQLREQLGAIAEGPLEL
jgi:Ser/Thr protein kinase RdoA (MazF antagonist)